MKRLVFVSSILVAAVVSASNGLMTVSDVRVAPFLQSRWGQAYDTDSSATGNPCFNYYTPNNGPCGCAATAMAQIIRYWQYPANAPAGDYQCAIVSPQTGSETPQTLAVTAGLYDWANMPMDTRAGIPENQRQAIGKLTYDCAVALHTHFGILQTGSYAYSDFAFSVFTDTFGYANAMGYCPAGISFADIKNAIFANFDLKCPVMISLVTADGLQAHQVLADGYGFEGGVAYVHIVCGWPWRSDLCDCWYPLPNVDTDSNVFAGIDGIVYNIFPEWTGDILSGRVLDSTGNPVAGVNVSASWSTGTAKSSTTKTEYGKTDENGVYAFWLEGGKTYTVACEGASKSVKLPKSVSAVCSWADPLRPYIPDSRKIGTLGNSWGNDLTIGGSPDPEPDPEPDPGEEDPLGAFNPGKAVNGVAPYVGAVYDADGVACGTVSLKVGKASSKGVSKISGTISLLDGKKYSVKSTPFAVNATGPTTVTGIEVKKIGTIDLKVGANGFEAVIDKTDGSALTAATADLTQGLPAGTATFSVADFPETFNAYPVLAECSPDGQTFTVAKKWDCGKAASPKYAKVYDRDPVTGKKLKTYSWELQGLTDPKKPNLSGLKLTYTAKTASFKGSFYLYTDVGTEAKPKLKKTTVSVTGFVIDGKGVGTATAKEGKTPRTWSVEIE